MIVEDDESARRSLVLILGKHGYEIETAQTGQAALAKARVNDFNLALLGMKLSDMEGTDLIEPMMELHPDIVVMMVTGHAAVETAVKSLSMGASNYLTKPLDMDKMLAEVKMALEKQGAERALAESEKLFRSTFEQAAVGISQTTPDGRFIKVNQRYCDIVGYPKEELLAKTFSEITYPDDLDSDLELVRQVLAGELQTFSLEKRLSARIALLCG